MPSILPKKLFYKIGEVCEIMELEPYVLRYWEKEFPVLSPQKNSAGQRIYSNEDVTVVQKIKTLLYDEGYTIEGARRQLLGSEEVHFSGDLSDDGLLEENRALKRTLRKFRLELSELRKTLNNIRKD